MNYRLLHYVFIPHLVLLDLRVALFMEKRSLQTNSGGRGMCEDMESTAGQRLRARCEL